MKSHGILILLGLASGAVGCVAGIRLARELDD
jgi:hypothetical protein